MTLYTLCKRLYCICLRIRHILNISGWFDYLDVSFFVRRRIGHYVIRIFFPCILCTVVSWLPFWMDRGEIGDRGALGITTLLTEVFLLQYTNDSMPRVSYVKAADLFLIVSFAFTFMALLESVIVYNYKRKFGMTENDQVKNLTGGRTFFRKRVVRVEEVRRNTMFNATWSFNKRHSTQKALSSNWI